MFVKALILPGIILPKTVNIQSSMNYIPFQKLATHAGLLQIVLQIAGSG
jgi:hypothetical protein